jgi:hypothetical protein
MLNVILVLFAESRSWVSQRNSYVPQSPSGLSMEEPQLPFIGLKKWTGGIDCA